MRKLLFLFFILLSLFFVPNLAFAQNPYESHDCANRSTQCSDKTLYPDEKCQEHDPGTGRSGYDTRSCTSVGGCIMTKFKSNGPTGTPIVDKYYCAGLADNAPTPPPGGYSCSNLPPNCNIGTVIKCDPPSRSQTCGGAGTCSFSVMNGVVGGTVTYCAWGTIPHGSECNPLDYSFSNFRCEQGTSCIKNTTDNKYTCKTSEDINGDYFKQKGLPCDNANCDNFTTALGTIGTNPADFVKWILGFILSISGGIVLLIIIAAGYRLMTSQGDPEKVKAAREQLTSAVVGLLFIIFSLVILQAITVDILHIPGISK